MKEMIFRTSDDGLVTSNTSEIELVRCKDCKYGEQLFTDYISCQISDENESGCHASHRPEWFCADGERKDDDA